MLWQESDKIPFTDVGGQSYAVACHPLLAQLVHNVCALETLFNSRLSNRAVPVVAGIEEIGVQIEEPFSILALENLCRKAERHISGMMLVSEHLACLLERTTACKGRESVNMLLRFSV